MLAGELEDRDYYREANVFWVPEAARWEALRAAAKQPDIGKRIDDALALIEAENPKLKGILDKRFARAQLPDGKLGELVDLVSTIGFGATASEARDVPGQVYEYFLGMFASAEGKRTRRGEVLFIDARKLAVMISRVQCELTNEVIDRIAGTVAAWRGEAAAVENADVAGCCRSVGLAEIAEHGHVLTPGRYVGAEAVEDNDADFATKMQGLTEKLGEQMAKGAELDAVIRAKLGGLGYEF